MEEYDEMMVEVNEEVTEVGQMLNLYEQWKVAGTHSKAVSFHKVAKYVLTSAIMSVSGEASSADETRLSQCAGQDREGR